MLRKYERIVAYSLLIILVVSLLPVIYLGRYNHPTGDDYYYGGTTKAVWEQTGSIVETVAEAARGVAYQYDNWQGTYSAMLLMYLPPNIFGDWAYRCITGMLLLLLVGSIFYLCKPIVCCFLKGTKELWIMLSSLLSLLCVQTVPSQGETFFWYNGSMYYTGYYAMTLFFFGMVLRYLLKPRKYHFIILLVLAVFLAGGNYVSLLPAIIIMVLLTIFLIYKRSEKAWRVGLIAVFLIIGLGVSAVAPGNAVRQSGMWKIPAWKAIAKSLLQGVRYTFAWIRGWWLLAVTLMTPFLWNAFNEGKLRLKYPLIMVGLSYGIFCSMSCPTFYTMNSTGPARAVAIVYYGFLLFSFVVYVYLLGCIHGLVERKKIQSFSPFRAVWGVIVLVLLGVLVVSGQTVSLTTGKAVRSLVSGEARAYEQEYRERLQVLENDAIQDVVFEPYRNRPDMLYVGDLTGDAQDDTNQKVAQYFGKNTVRVDYD